MFSEKGSLRATSDEDFRSIYEALMPVIYKVAYNIVREGDIAEDICLDKNDRKKDGIPVYG